MDRLREAVALKANTQLESQAKRIFILRSVLKNGSIAVLLCISVYPCQPEGCISEFVFPYCCMSPSLSSVPRSLNLTVFRSRTSGREGCLVAHDELELARAELAVGVAEGPIARDAREVRRRHVDSRRKVLPGGTQR